jgi:hypothetical protein
MIESQFQESIDTFKVRFEGGNSIGAETYLQKPKNTIELAKTSSHAIDSNAF